jgi:hypothetical protein
MLIGKVNKNSILCSKIKVHKFFYSLFESELGVDEWMRVTRDVIRVDCTLKLLIKFY